MDQKQKTLLSLAIMLSLARAENGGTWPENPTAGKSGETKSIFQFTPATWKNYAGETLGDPNAPMTPDAEATVVQKKVKKWLDQDYTPPQIASMWNAGQGEPDAYTGKFSNGKPSVGVNKQYNVPYDVPSYAKRVENYTVESYKKLSSSSNVQQTQNSTNNVPDDKFGHI